MSGADHGIASGMKSMVRATFIVGALAPVVLAFAPAVAAPPAPDFSGIWWHPSLPGPEPLASGPTMVVNRMRMEDGTENYGELVGDYTNPVLKPDAAAVVKKFGERSLAGEVFPNPANQCWPEPGPFIYKNFGLQILPSEHGLTLIYDQDHEVRHVRMNAAHPKHIMPSWYGDSVGHYEGDTLVIDTVGIKADRPFAMVDLYGTPYTKALHMVERYRLISYEEAKDGIARDAKENMIIRGIRDPNYRGKFLQLTFTIEDAGVFTKPWSATMTYGRGTTVWPETVCAENVHGFAGDEHVPEAKSDDF